MSVTLSTSDAVCLGRATTRLAFFADERPVAMVVGHERSGVHFLMNSLGACYNYVSAAYIDLDTHTFNINYFNPRTVVDTLLGITVPRPLANTVKSHHAAEFFHRQLERLTQRMVLFYIYRDPAAVLLSHWRLIQQLHWLEGPRTSDALAFALAEPCGQMMRYQMCQHRNLIARWAAHVNGWLNAMQGNPRIVAVRYEDLDRRYESTLRGFAKVLESPPSAIVRPDRNGNYIPGEPVPEARESEFQMQRAQLRSLCEQTVASTMRRCGYLPAQATRD